MKRKTLSYKNRDHFTMVYGIELRYDKISLDVAYLNSTCKNQLISSALGIQSDYENDGMLAFSALAHQRKKAKR